uniref:AAA family ATPase n=1 Tax=Bosea sp. NBC_00436 TaxID=2969620 RepID=A0A9E8A7H8_9HYPH
MSPRFESRGAASSRDASMILAKALMTRALRHGGVYHVLLRQPGIVGFIVPEVDAELFAAAAQSMLKRHRVPFYSADFDVVHWTGERPKPGFRSPDEVVKALLPKTERIFGIASRESDIPNTFRLVADAVIEIEPVDLRVLRGVFRIVLGRAPADHDLVPAVGAPLHALGAAIKRGRTPEAALRRLRGLAAAVAQPAPQTLQSGPSLSDLHGYGEAAEWGRALAIDLADYQSGRITWVDVDRGVVLSGPPGVGKTIYARALARTCNVLIFVHSLARWQAKGYLNDLLKAMRAAFDEAKKNAPCILFLDELDSFGDRENVNDRNEQYTREVINGFLECLDGVEGREGVVVVGATNWPGKIDAAILRPGRLDRHIRIPLPDASARVGILRHHFGDALPETALPDIAERLEGATGAAIEQLARDARRTARRARRALLVEDVLASLPERVRLSDDMHRRACFHEAGHAVVGYLLREASGSRPTEAKALREVGADGSGGHTSFDHELGSERTRDRYLAQITVMLAGIAAEQVAFGEHGAGGGGEERSDLHVATMLAASMELSYGLGQGLAFLSGRRDESLMAWLRSDTQVRQCVEAGLKACLQRARGILEEHRGALDAIVDLLARRGRVVFGEIAEAVESHIVEAERSNCRIDGNASLASRSKCLVSRSEVPK